MNALKKVPWVQLLWPTLIVVLFYAYTQNVKAAIRDELRNYVTVEQYQAYRDSERRVTDEIMKRIDSRFDAQDLAIRENNQLLRELLQRRPPAPTMLKPQ